MANETTTRCKKGRTVVTSVVAIIDGVPQMLFKRI
jgi:hypothetical protein